MGKGGAAVLVPLSTKTNKCQIVWHDSVLLLTQIMALFCFPMSFHGSGAKESVLTVDADVGEIKKVADSVVRPPARLRSIRYRAKTEINRCLPYHCQLTWVLALP